ncbi:hypothetical protein AVEN_162429-1 [Araneus ventricosus]|uniref:Uncharacterized protein n=1 Tax=Araneus ventricosus TaxID=182803 RepID=A0A4Y2NKZ3_ARAVE|nr:hypothetical protein AVEN_162429-1 [Araneus ventricosus]
MKKQSPLYSAAMKSIFPIENKGEKSTLEERDNRIDLAHHSFQPIDPPLWHGTQQVDRRLSSRISHPIGHPSSPISTFSHGTPHTVPEPG